MLDNNTFQHIEETISYQLSSIKTIKPEPIRISPSNPDYDKIHFKFQQYPTIKKNCKL